VRKQRTQAAFNAAADNFDDRPLVLDLCGRRTVELAGIRSGDRVLDVCCGPARPRSPRRGGRRHRLGLGVDLAERLLELGRAKAKEQGLPVTFRRGDIDHLDVEDASFDAVVCVFGVFFVEDMARSMRELWRPSAGRCWRSRLGAAVLEPGDEVYGTRWAGQRPDLARRHRPAAHHRAARAARPLRGGRG